MKFFNTLAGFANIDQETYRCELIVTPLSLHSPPDPNPKPLRRAGHEGNSGWEWGSRQPSNLLLVGSVAPGPPPVYLKATCLRKGAETLAPTLGGGGQCWLSVGSGAICMVGG